MVTLRYLAFAAAFAIPLPASAAILVEIDKSSQRMTVSQNGQRLYTWPVSTGKRGHSTPSGSFKAFRMEKDHFSREWDDAPMPNSISLQDRPRHPWQLRRERIGTPASHGCVRLTPENAAILFSLVKADGVLNTQVVLTGVEPPPSEHNSSRARRKTRSECRAPQYPNPNAAPLPGEDQNFIARSAPNNSLDNQAYGSQSYGNDDRYPAPTYRYPQRAPTDDQRYAQDGTYPPRYQQQQPAYRQQQQPYYGGGTYQQQPQPYYGSRYPDPYYSNPPQPYYRRGYGY